MAPSYWTQYAYDRLGMSRNFTWWFGCNTEQKGIKKKPPHMLSIRDYDACYEFVADTECRLLVAVARDRVYVTRWRKQELAKNKKTLVKVVKARRWLERRDVKACVRVNPDEPWYKSLDCVGYNSLVTLNEAFSAGDSILEKHREEVSVISNSVY